MVVKITGKFYHYKISASVKAIFVRRIFRRSPEKISVGVGQGLGGWVVREVCAGADVELPDGAPGQEQQDKIAHLQGKADRHRAWLGRHRKNSQKRARTWSRTRTCR